MPLQVLSPGLEADLRNDEAKLLVNEVRLFIDESTERPVLGVLMVTGQRIMFLRQGECGAGVLEKSFSFGFDDFMCCAVQNDTSQFPYACLWIMGGESEFSNLRFVLNPADGESEHQAAERGYRAMTQAMSSQDMAMDDSAVLPGGAGDGTEAGENPFGALASVSSIQELETQGWVTANNVESIDPETFFTEEARARLQDMFSPGMELAQVRENIEEMGIEDGSSCKDDESM